MAKRTAQSAGVAGFLFGSGLRIALSSLATLAMLGLVGFAAWALYDYAGLKQAKRGLATQQQQAADHLKALGIEQRRATRDREQLEQADRTVAAIADVDAPGPRWLTAWLNCVHPDSDVQSCARVADPRRGAGPPDPAAGRDGGRPAGGAEQGGDRPPQGAPAPENHRRAAAGLPGVTE